MGPLQRDEPHRRPAVASNPRRLRGWDLGSATEPTASGRQASLTVLALCPTGSSAVRGSARLGPRPAHHRPPFPGGLCACARAVTGSSRAALALGHLSWSVNRGGPRRTGVSVIGRLLLPHVQWPRVPSPVLVPGFLLRSRPRPPLQKHVHTCPRHGTHGPTARRGQGHAAPFCSVHEGSVRQAGARAAKTTRKEV